MFKFDKGDDSFAPPMGQTLTKEKRNCEAFVFAKNNCCEKCAITLVSKGFKSATVLANVSADKLEQYGIQDGHLENLLHALEKLRDSKQQPPAYEHIKKDLIREVSPVPETPSSQNCDVMISYQSEHQKEVLKIRDALSSCGFKVVLDQDLVAGDMHQRRRDAIAQGKVVVSCLNQQYAGSQSLWSEFLNTGRLHINFDNSPDVGLNDRENGRDEMKLWLRPETVEIENDAQERFRRQFLGTREWLYADIIRFAYSDSDRVYWITGSAGSGKSVVSAVVSARLQKIGRLGGYFSFSYNNVNRNTPIRLIATLSYQLSKQFPEFARSVERVLKSEDSFLERASVYHSFDKLILEPLRNISPEQRRPVVLVVDALDECEVISAPDRRALIHIITTWNEVPDFVKLFVTSRLDIDIKMRFMGIIEAHDIDSDALHRNDLVSFSTYRLRLLKDRMGITTAEVDGYAEKLSKKANGSFIWLNLIVDEICHEDSDSLMMLKDLVTETSESVNLDGQLDWLYLSLLKRCIEGKSPSFVKLLSQMLAAITVVRTPVSDEFLAKLFAITLVEAREKLATARSLLIISDDNIQLLHRSFAEFLQSPKRCTDLRFLVDKRVTNEFLAQRCLDFATFGLRFDIDHVDGKDLTLTINSLPKHVKYGAKYLVSHLLDCDLRQIPVPFETSFERFCSTNLSQWIEVLSQTNSLYAASGQLTRLIPNVSNEKVGDLLKDVSRLVDNRKTK
ncbi:hypothetical protein HK098_004614 [Nowakowskiella sp. JEL0407]|nr:hypothetical protein HK098_004614 [Nowakowskiella sp. JEL0407]